tara:strand:- start:167 stop:391 length:225 start_codon:yes stop_codon:yes gene_type:complete
MKKKQEKRIMLRKFLINFFNLDINYKGEISYECIDNWDSISHIELMSQLEKKFKIKTKKISFDLISEKEIFKLL